MDFKYTQRMTRKLVTFGVVFLGTGMLLGLQLGRVFFGDDTAQSLKKLEDAFILINQQYVETVDAGTLAEKAIEGMLEQLDPHSVYINAAQMREVAEDFNASFEGIGISYDFIAGATEGRDTLMVLSVIPGGPSEEAGLLSGDRILSVNDSSAIGFTSEDVQRNLKGPRGTKVTVSIKRPGHRDVLTMTITRDKIPLYTVEADYMVDDRTGYIRLNRFARTTYTEFLEALNRLKGQGMQQLVLDLRGNAGGYMDQAIRISDEFLTAGQLIVSQKGRLPEANEQFYARSGGSWERQPVIVLVDENAASASEIVTGALQDHDRALIVGRRTFGKGLVQKQFQLNDGSAMRVTIARYYTPTGRLIQTPYENGKQEEYYRSKYEQQSVDRTLSAEEILQQVPDSLKYRTDNGRIVLAGGGILPDYVVPVDSLSPFMQAVLGRNLESNWVRLWLDENGPAIHRQWDRRKEAFIQSFEVSDAMMEAFLAYAGQQGVQVVDGVKPQDTETVRYFSRAELAADKDRLQAILKGRLGTRLYDRSTWYPIYHSQDRVFREALQHWDVAQTLASRYSEARR